MPRRVRVERNIYNADRWIAATAVRLRIPLVSDDSISVLRPGWRSSAPRPRDQKPTSVPQPVHSEQRDYLVAMGIVRDTAVLALEWVGVWSSTEWSPAASLIFLLDPNRLAALASGLDAEEAVEELVGPVRKSLGKTGATVQIEATARSLTGVSAYELMTAHRQIDLDVLPTGNFAAEDEIAQAAAGSNDR